MTKVKKIELIREILYKYKIQENLSKKDFDFMLEILSHHPDAKNKIGVGIKRMWIENVEYGNRTFWFERIDGSKTDFSFYKCLTKPNNHADFLKACRYAVAETIISFRDLKFGDNKTLICPILGVSFKKNRSHVDHIIPFISIAKEFYETIKKDIEYLRGDGFIGVCFADKELEKKWIKFHNERAILRVISEKANLQLSKAKW